MNDRRLFDIPVDAMEHLAPDESWQIGDYVAAACLLEATAPKAGNVHPEARFEDMDYEDFRSSARTTADVFERNIDASCGKLILMSVQATQEKVGKNTNLGIILLLAPLVIAARPLLSNASPSFRNRWMKNLSSTLESLTASDSSMVYQAITIAKPGGLGKAETMDVRQSAPEELMSAMRAAAAWDDIAKQYTTNFSDVFELSERLDRCRKEGQFGWLHSLCLVQIGRLASHGDSLIARKNGSKVVDDVKKLAAKVLRTSSLSGVDLVHQAEWKQLDDFLRADGHRRNPGTTADLLAAATLVSLLNGVLNEQQDAATRISFLGF